MFVIFIFFNWLSTVIAFHYKHKKNRELHLFAPEVLQYPLYK